MGAVDDFSQFEQAVFSAIRGRAEDLPEFDRHIFTDLLGLPPGDAQCPGVGGGAAEAVREFEGQLQGAVAAH